MDSCAGSDTQSREGWRADKPAVQNPQAASWSHSTAPCNRETSPDDFTEVLHFETYFCSKLNDITAL